MRYQVTASRIATAMSDAGMSQQELANKSGINKSSISHYINGSHQPGNKAAYAIAKALDVDPLWLMGLDVEVHQVPALVPTFHNVGTYKAIRIDAKDVKADAELLRLYHNATPSAQESVLVLLKNSQKKTQTVKKVKKVPYLRAPRLKV